MAAEHAAGAVGRAGGGGRRARRARRPRHPAPRGRPAAVRPRARPRPCRRRDPHLRHARWRTFAVSFSPRKGDFIGRAALARQQRAYERILVRDWSSVADLPRLVQPVAVTGSGVARQGADVFREGEHVGLGHERHRRPVLERRGRRPALDADRRAQPAHDRAGLHRQPDRRGRHRGGRRPRAAPARDRGPLPPAQRGPAVRALDRLGPRARTPGAARRRPAPARRCACSTRPSPTTSGARRSASTSSLRR